MEGSEGIWFLISEFLILTFPRVPLDSTVDAFLKINQYRSVHYHSFVRCSPQIDLCHYVVYGSGTGRCMWLHMFHWDAFFVACVCLNQLRSLYPLTSNCEHLQSIFVKQTNLPLGHFCYREGGTLVTNRPNIATST